MAEPELKPERDSRTVFVADSHQLAEAVISLLAVNGIEAELQTTSPVAHTDPLLGLSDTATPDDFPIIVADSSKINDARELLTTAENVAALQAVKEKRAARTGNITATCEDCGKQSEWPAAAMGTTEVCPHCAQYMDIPDPDDDWSNMDFGEPEEETEPKE